MADTPNCVDMSRWGGELTLDEARDMILSGVRSLIVATGPGGYGQMAYQQAKTWVDAGGEILEAYTFLEWGRDPIAWCEVAYGRLGNLSDRVDRWWVDVEDVDHPPPQTIAQRNNYVARGVETLDALTRKVTGIYSARWYWPDPVRGMGDSQAFRHRPLWNSWYDGAKDIDGLPYGGWTPASVAIEQYQGTTTFAGQSVDLNWMYIAPRQREAEVEMQEQIDTLYLASFSGSEESSLPREERLANARYRATRRTIVTDDGPMLPSLGERIEAHKHDDAAGTVLPIVANG